MAAELQNLKQKAALGSFQPKKEDRFCLLFLFAVFMNYSSNKAFESFEKEIEISILLLFVPVKMHCP